MNCSTYTPPKDLHTISTHPVPLHGRVIKAFFSVKDLHMICTEVRQESTAV